MATSYPGVRRSWPGNDDNADGAGGILVVVKFLDAVGITGKAEDNDNTAVAELTGVGASVPNGPGRPGFSEAGPGLLKFSRI